jgi:hypothetical protein
LLYLAYESGSFTYNSLVFSPTNLPFIKPFCDSLIINVNRGLILGPLLYRLLYLAYESGSFTDFQYQGVITCIPKEGKDRRFIGNWRSSISSIIVFLIIFFFSS